MYWLRRFKKPRKANTAMEDALKISRRETSFLDDEWVSATKTRNFMLKDPLLDWLDLHGAAKGFRSDDEEESYDPRTDFTRFVSRKGREFEHAVVEHLQSLVRVSQVAHGPRDIRSPDAAAKTLQLMQAREPMVFQGVLHDFESMTFGSPDLLVRSDVLRRLFPDAISEEESRMSAEHLHAELHYCVVDVKFTTLGLLKDGELGNSGSSPAYKAQLYVYNQALGRLQGYLPPRAFLLGRGWKQLGERGHSCMQRLAPVSHDSMIGKEPLSDRVADAIDWVRRVRSEGHTWEVLPVPSVSELRPNMGNQADFPWHGARREVAQELGELTLLWQVGIDKRRAANECGITTLTEVATAADVGVKGPTQAAVLDAMLDINSDAGGPLVRPRSVVTAEDQWRAPQALEFYVDFETVSDLDDDFTRIPDKGGQALIFMVGCGHVEEGVWKFRCFTAQALTEDAEAAMLDDWFAHMHEVKARRAAAGEDPLVFHWSHAEVSTLVSAYNSAVARHHGKDWPRVRWFDFLKEVARKEPVVVRGALGFGLKAIAKAMFQHGLIETSWGDGPTDGLGAMVGAWSAAEEASKANVALIETSLMSEIEAYNEVDCKVMMEIIHYLRAEH
jgi:hypothetical protein